MIIKDLYNEKNWKSTALCFALCVCVHACIECIYVLIGIAGYVGHIQFLNSCLLHHLTDFLLDFNQRNKNKKGGKKLLFQSSCSVLSPIV